MESDMFKNKSWLTVLSDHRIDDGAAAVLPENALLPKTRALQTAILSSATFSIIATDTQGIIQLFNVGAERMLGFRAVDVINKIRPSDIHDRQEVAARAQALSLELGTTIAPGFEALAFKASRGIEDIYELTYICKDGGRFPAIVSITALRDPQDAIIGYLLIGTHNSVRTRVELELNSARAAAEQANRAKSEFLSSMSHELRTPLSAILGFAQLIESGLPSPTTSQKRSLDQILKAGWYLLDLINEILDLALIESGKLSLSLEPISLSEVMRESQAMIAAGAEAGHQRELSPVRHSLLYQGRSHTSEAGPHQPAFQRHQVQQRGRNDPRGLHRECTRARAHLRQRHRRGVNGRSAGAAVSAVQSPRARGQCREGHRHWSCGV
jgi:signal transduction histidine kinase